MRKLRGGKSLWPRRWRGRQQSGLPGANAADRRGVSSVTAAEVVVADAAVADVVAAANVAEAVDARTADVFAATTAATATTLSATRRLAVDKKTHFSRLPGIGVFARGVRVHVQRFGPLWLAHRRRHDLLSEVPLPEYDLLERWRMLRHCGRRGVLFGVTTSAAAAATAATGTAIRFVRSHRQRVVAAPPRLVRLLHRRLSRPAAESARRATVPVHAAVPARRPLVMIKMIAHRLRDNKIIS